MLTWAMRKPPDAALDYYFDVGPWMEPPRLGDTDAAEAVTSLAAAVRSGTVVIASQTPIGGMLKLDITGGAAGEVAQIEVTLVTSKGRTYTEVVRLRVGV